MNKVFVLRPSEDWIVDRLVTEWYEGNSDISVFNPAQSDVIWLLANWCYRNIDPRLLSTKRVVTTIHHIVVEKFDQNKLLEFQHRDSFTDVYHVPNCHTESIVKQLTKKPIHVIPYWANQNIWRQTGTKLGFRKKHSLPLDNYLIGSFQRDTEGHDLKTPKLEKGPDLFVDAVEKFWRSNKSLHVVLAGWRRQYVVSRLEKSGIPYSYFDRPSQETINELYQTLDLYPVTSRAEGGPQSLIECGLLNIPVVSRNIGMASLVLNKASIADDVTMATPFVPNVEELKLNKGFEKYRKLMNSL